jgi:SAM-dependent methyltransferase
VKSNCIFCKAASGDYVTHKEGWNLFECRVCKIIYVSPLPEDRFLAEEVYGSASGYSESRVNDEDDTSQDIDQALPKLKTLLKGIPAPLLLDIGASQGDFLLGAQTLGFKVQGVEANPQSAEKARARGLQVQTGMYSKVLYEESSFDAINLGDVIEHVSNPLELVENIAFHLKNKGFLSLSTPNTDCFWFKGTRFLSQKFSIPWSAVTPPYHLYYFSVDNLDALLSEYGLKKIDNWFKSTWLLYELSHLHLLRDFRRDKTFFRLIKLLYGYSMEVSLFIIYWFLRRFMRKDFSYRAIYVKSFPKGF